MRGSPLPTLATTLRVFIKAALLLVILNLVFIAAQIDPIATLTRINSWWLVGHGRTRLAYPSDFQNGQLPVESLIGAHAIAYTPKVSDEYRVIVLGESGIAGWGLDDPESLTGQLTAKAVRINGKRLIAYNLAYPSPSAARDVIILDAVLQYKPDLIIWFVTPAAVDDAPSAIGTNSVFFDLNRERLKRLTDENDLQSWFNARLRKEASVPAWLALRGQDTIPVWLNSLFYPFESPDLGKTDRRLDSEPIPARARYTTGRAGFDPMPNDTWRFLEVGRKLANSVGAQVLLVNEPMLIGHGTNSEVNYNLQYERAFYDNYREILQNYATRGGFLFADLWDVIPAKSFTDTPLHADASGYAALVESLVKELGKLGELKF